MGTWINPDIFRETGFRDIADGEVVEAEFYRIHVFKLNGCSLNYDKSIVEVSGDIDGSGYRLGIGSSINHICRTILDDDFVDDEEKWTKEKNTAPPYLRKD